MNVLDRYIASYVVLGTAAADAALALLVSFFTFSDELRAINRGTYGLTEIIKYVALVTPGHAVTLLPSAALVGGLITLGALAEKRELVAMQAAGYSMRRIIAVVLAVGLGFSAIEIVLGELVIPVLERSAEVHRSLSQKHEVSLHSRYGIWVRQGTMFVNIRAIDGQNKLRDVLIYSLNETGLLESATHVETADFLDNRWQLKGIRHSMIGADSVQTQSRETGEWALNIVPDFLDTLLAEPRTLSIEDLSLYLNHLEHNGQRDREAELAFWTRVFSPLVTETMLLMALPFVMTNQRTVHFGQRMVIGILLGLSFYLVDRTTGHLGLMFGFPAWITAAAPALLALVLAMIYLRQARRL